MTELSREAIALIDAVGTTDGPGEDNRARVRRRLAASAAIAAAGVTVAKSAGAGSKLVAASAAGGMGAVGAAKVSTTVTSLVLWALAGGALGVSVMVPTVMLTSRSDAPKPAATSAARVVSTVTPAPGKPEQVTADSAPRAGELFEATPTSIPDAPNPAVPTAVRAPRAGAVAPNQDPAAAVPVAEATPEVSLALEMKLLTAAQRELAQNRAGAALKLLDEHAVQFPNGALSAERSAARVLALCALGRTAEARRLGAEFLRVAPKSPLVPRIRESCAGAGRE